MGSKAELVRLFGVLLTLLLVGNASTTLVAYYPFDGDLTGITGYCFGSGVQAGSTKNGAALSPGPNDGKFGRCAILTQSNHYVTINPLNLFPSADSSQFSVSAWVRMNSGSYSNRVIVQKPNSLRVQLYAGQGSKANYSLSCKIVHYAGIQSAAGETRYVYPASNTYWTHIACTYNTTHVCAALNGTIVECKAAAAPQITIYENEVNIGFSSESFRGSIDEVKFYDHALSYSEIGELSSGVAANDVPSVDISTDDSQEVPNRWSIPALYEVALNATATDERRSYSGAPNPDLTYKWSILSTSCTIATLSNDSSPTPTIYASSLGSFDLRVCATDGELSASSIVTILVSASAPKIQKQPEGPIVEIPQGSIQFPIEVIATGVPPPTYQWQYRILVPASNSSNDTVPEARYYRYMEDPDVDPEFHQLIVRSNGSFVEEWVNIDGATSNVLFVNATDEFEDMVIRCLITSSGSFITTSTYTLAIGSAQPSPSPQNPSSSGSDSGAIIGGVVGGVAGLALLLLLLLLILIVIILRRNNRRRQKRLRQPDYVELAYGSPKNEEGSFSKNKIQALLSLERLLLAEEGRIVHAASVKLVATDADKLAKAVMCVFEANHQGYAILTARISAEIEAAPNAGTLFRSNSLAARMFSYYVRMSALQYLWYTLVTSVHSLHDNAQETFGSSGSEVLGSKKSRYRIDKSDLSDHSFSMDLLSTKSMEIDPTRIDDASDTTINSLELWLVAQKLFKCIVESEKIMPTQIKQVLRHVDSEVGQRFDSQTQFRALGGFYFLRMVCPALMAPQVYGLIEAPPHPVAQRQLILVAKVLQNLANDTLPGQKEQYMEQLNSFIATNKNSLERFYAKILEGADRGRPAETEVPHKIKLNALNNLHRYLAAHINDIEQAMAEDGGQEDLIKELKDVLAQLSDEGV